MIYEEVTTGSRTRRTLTGAARILFELKLDGPLIIGLALVALPFTLLAGMGVATVVLVQRLRRDQLRLLAAAEEGLSPAP